jgi:outer membrane protein assembly factor BamB
VAVAGIRLSEPGTEPDALDRLYPLTPGTTWVYRTTENGRPTGLHVKQVVGTALVKDGQSAAIVYSHYDRLLGSPSASVTYIGRRGSRLVSFGERSLTSGKYEAYDPPSSAYELPLSAGHRWTYRGMLGDSSVRTDSRLDRFHRSRVMGRTVDGCADFTVDFVDALQTGVRLEIRGGETACPGIGTVRSSQVPSLSPVRIEEELVEYHAPGINLGGVGGLPRLDLAAPASGPGQTLGMDSGRSNHLAGAVLDIDHMAWSDTRTSNIQFPPVARGSVSVLAEEDGTVSATDVRRGNVLWRLRVPGPVVASPVVAGPVVLVADAKKALYAFDGLTGYTRWALRLPYLVATAPVVSGRTVVVVGDDRTVRGLRLADGRALWQAKVGDIVQAPPALSGDTVIVGDQSGGLTALSVADGSAVWEAGLDGSLTSGPVAFGGLVVAADDTSAVYGFNAGTGKSRWTAYPDAVPDVSPAVGQGAVVFVAPETHRLVALDPKNGDVKWRVPFEPRVLTPPVIVGDSVAVLTYDPPSLRRFSLEDGGSRGEVAFHGPGHSTALTGRFPLSYVDGSLVVSLRQDSPWPNTTLLAFPASNGTGSPPLTQGIRFGGEIRPFPSGVGLQGPATLVGDDVIVPGQDKTLWRVPPVGRPEALLRSRDMLPFAVTAGRVILSQRGTALVAVPLGGGSPRWEFPMGPPFRGAAPAVMGETAVVPIRGKGLAGIAVASGKDRWFQPFPPSVGVSSPLPLPGGDVVYIAGSVKRVDPVTGRVSWSVDGIEALSRPAYLDGTVFVHGFKNGRGVLIALDADEGRERWVTPLDIAPLAGPAAAEGVVVGVDGSRQVMGFDAVTGKELWSYPLRNEALGAPIIMGRRVVIAERSRTEDAADRDYRLAVLDLHTGRYAGSFEPGGGAFGAPGSLGASRDFLLVPSVSGGGAAVMMLRLEGP